ncbi:tripartite motif-containing protein 16-like protein [Aulostomus maculatus]
MELNGEQLYIDAISCAVCLGVMKKPVTIPCGHSFCKSCIKGYWSQKVTFTCPQCRHVFKARPRLGKDITLTNLVKYFETHQLPDPPCDRDYAGPGEGGCDVCIGRKLRASKYCVFCQVAYCDKHLQPHLDSPAFQKHVLVEPSERNQDNMRSWSEKIQMVDAPDHPARDTDSADIRRAQKENDMVKKRIQEKRKYIKELQLEVMAINRSAGDAVKHSGRCFTDMIHAVKRRRADVRDIVKAKQLAELKRVREVWRHVRREIAELQKEAEELKQLAPTELHSPFLQNYPSLPHLNDNTRPRHYFDSVATAVADTAGTVNNCLTENVAFISQQVTQADVLLSRPRTREDLLQYSQHITLDPNTAHRQLLLSEGNRKVTKTKEEQPHSPHPDRFRDWPQVLSTETLTGRCYWEVERTGTACAVAVTYKDAAAARSGIEVGLGTNDSSWAISYENQCYMLLHHNQLQGMVPGPLSSRIGVYLDQHAGQLSFYSIADNQTMNLLFNVEGPFTQPLHAGLYIKWVGDTVELVEPGSRTEVQMNG